MLFAYETERLLLKIIKPDQADAVLDFYMRDKELFEKFEPDRMPNFYTRQFQRQMLLFEYNMQYREHCSGFMYMRKSIRSVS